MDTQRKKRVCCFCETWESGGIESFLCNVLSRMDFSQLEVDLVAAEIRESIFTAELQRQGVRFYELSGNQRNLFRNWPAFLALLRERKYDVIHFNVFQGLSLFYVHLARQAGIPVRIAHSHNTALRKSRTRCLKQRVHLLGRAFFSGEATAWWACSAAAASFMFSQGVLTHQEFRLIPNGIETERFRFHGGERAQVREELGLSRAFVIGHVGRLCQQKNQIFLLDIFSELVKRRPESRLLLAGTGELEPLLRKRSSELGIAEQVIFFGVTDKIERLLWAMDAFVFPSLFEGLGIAVVEAQAAGLPVFCSEHVPEEARVTSQFHTIRLCESPLRWADALLAASIPDTDRAAGAGQVREAGFEIDDVAREIQEAYLGCDL